MTLIIVNGRMGNKPEVKQSKNGTNYLSFSLAFSEKKGQKEETTWYRCMWMHGDNSSIATYLDKGSSVSVVGRLQKPKVYTNRNGNHEIDLTIFVSDVNFLPSSKPAEKGEYAASMSIHSGAQEKIEEDGLPF